jgi:hypothetical protein
MRQERRVTCISAPPAITPFHSRSRRSASCGLCAEVRCPTILRRRQSLSPGSGHRGWSRSARIRGPALSRSIDCRTRIHSARTGSAAARAAGMGWVQTTKSWQSAVTVAAGALPEGDDAVPGVHRARAETGPDRPRRRAHVSRAASQLRRSPGGCEHTARHGRRCRRHREGSRP